MEVLPPRDAGAAVLVDELDDVVIIEGVIIGVVESMAVLYLPEGINSVAAYVLLLLVLMVRPQGLFGIQSKRRV